MAKKTKFRNVRRFNRDNKKIIIIGIIILAIVLSAAAFIYINFYAVGPTTGRATVKVYDLGDKNKNISDKAELSVYKVYTTGLTMDEILDLDYDDYKPVLEDHKASSASFDIEEGYQYKMKIEYKDTVIWQTPDVGENNVLIVDKSESLIFLTFDDNLNTTMLGNDETDYTVRVATDNNEGFMCSYLLNKDESTLIWFDLNFTVDAEEDFAEIKGYHNDEHTNGTHLYIGITGSIIENAEFTLEFDSDKADTFDCNAIDIGFGLYDEDDIDYFD